jgi:hypothetical protein
MLSKQCDIKLQSLLLNSSGAALGQLQQSLQDLKDLCQLPDDDDTEEDEDDAVDWKEKLESATKGLVVPVVTDRLSTVRCVWHSNGRDVSTSLAVVRG